MQRGQRRGSSGWSGAQPGVGHVRPVRLVLHAACARRCPAGGAHRGHRPHGKLEHLLPVHVQVAEAALPRLAAAAERLAAHAGKRHVQVLEAVAVRVHVHAEQPVLAVSGGQQHRAAAVAKQDASACSRDARRRGCVGGRVSGCMQLHVQPRQQPWLPVVAAGTVGAWRSHAPRSFQSMYRDSASPPMTITLRYAPARMYCDPVIRAITKPLQAAVRSNAAALLAPIAACTCSWQGAAQAKHGVADAAPRQAVRPNSCASALLLKDQQWWWQGLLTWQAQPNKSSGVDVAKMMRSTSAAATPAAAGQVARTFVNGLKVGALLQGSSS